LKNILYQNFQFIQLRDVNTRVTFAFWGSAKTSLLLFLQLGAIKFGVLTLVVMLF